MRLMLIEDDPILGEGLRDFLFEDGHDVDWLRCLRDADAASGRAYDALLVDWQLPDGSGLDWVRARRRTGDMVPVLVLSARDLLQDRIHGLDSGADDYLVKPFDPEELVARIRAVRRRTHGCASTKLAFGAVTLDLDGRVAWLDNVQAELTAREWALVEALALRAGRIVAKRDLEVLVMGAEAEVASNALEVHVSSLRRKLGRELIHTARGLGYRIAA